MKDFLCQALIMSDVDLSVITEISIMSLALIVVLLVAYI